MLSWQGLRHLPRKWIRRRCQAAQAHSKAFADCHLCRSPCNAPCPPAASAANCSTTVPSTQLISKRCAAEAGCQQAARRPHIPPGCSAATNKGSAQHIQCQEQNHSCKNPTPVVTRLQAGYAHKHHSKPKSASPALAVVMQHAACCYMKV